MMRTVVLFLFFYLWKFNHIIKSEGSTQILFSNTDNQNEDETSLSNINNTQKVVLFTAGTEPFWESFWSKLEDNDTTLFESILSTQVESLVKNIQSSLEVQILTSKAEKDAKDIKKEVDKMKKQMKVKFSKEVEIVKKASNEIIKEAEKVISPLKTEFQKLQRQFEKSENKCTKNLKDFITKEKRNATNAANMAFKQADQIVASATKDTDKYIDQIDNDIKGLEKDLVKSNNTYESAKKKLEKAIQDLNKYNSSKNPLIFEQKSISVEKANKTFLEAEEKLANSTQLLEQFVTNAKKLKQEAMEELEKLSDISYQSAILTNQTAHSNAQHAIEEQESICLNLVASNDQFSQEFLTANQHIINPELVKIDDAKQEIKDAEEKAKSNFMSEFESLAIRANTKTKSIFDKLNVDILEILHQQI